MCMVLSLSSFVLFLDLSKAFDLALKEFVMGWAFNIPDVPTAKKLHLLSMGIPPESVDDTIA